MFGFSIAFQRRFCYGYFSNKFYFLYFKMIQQIREIEIILDIYIRHGLKRGKRKSLKKSKWKKKKNTWKDLHYTERFLITDSPTFRIFSISNYPWFQCEFNDIKKAEIGNKKIWSIHNKSWEVRRKWPCHELPVDDKKWQNPLSLHLESIAISVFCII